MTGSLESSSDDIATIHGEPGKTARYYVVTCIYISLIDLETIQCYKRPKSEYGKGDEMGAIKDVLFVVICLCGIHLEKPNLRRSYAKS